MKPQAEPRPSERAPTGPISTWSRVKQCVQPWLTQIVLVWFAGVFLSAFRPLLGWYTVRRLRTVGVSPVPDAVHAVMDRVTKRLRLARAVELLQSALVKTPAVVGCFRPAILLPLCVVTRLPEAQLELILAHELAHIRRHDYLVNLLQTLVETLFFYHPAVWWLSRQIRNERENCCDDVAMATGGSRADYGRALLAVAELRAAVPGLSLAAGGGSLLARIRRIAGCEPAPRYRRRCVVPYPGFARDMRRGDVGSGPGRGRVGAGNRTSGCGRASRGFNRKTAVRRTGRRRGAVKKASRRRQSIPTRFRLEGARGGENRRTRLFPHPGPAPLLRRILGSPRTGYGKRICSRCSALGPRSRAMRHPGFAGCRAVASGPRRGFQGPAGGQRG